MLFTFLACIPLLIWLYLLLGRGRFWLVSQHFIPANLVPAQGKKVCVVIPARDEAAVIQATVASLLHQQSQLSIQVIVVDDNSTDGTAEAARKAAEQANSRDKLTVLQGKPLPPGWSGKLWALSQGVELASGLHPDYLLFTDADIVHSEHNVSELVALAEARGYDLTSLMVKLKCATIAEKTLLPAFVFFFLKLYPPAWIASGRRKTAGAAGGCALIRPAALQRIGGLSAIRQEVIDDCALAGAVKANGGSVWLGLAKQNLSTRSYGTFRDVGAMISRTAFNQLHHSILLLIATTLGLVVTYVLPLVFLFTGHASVAALGLVTWLLMSLAYLPMVRFYGQSVLWAFALPAIATFYMGATIHSAVRYWSGKGGTWKGRVQDVRQ